MRSADKSISTDHWFKSIAIFITNLLQMCAGQLASGVSCVTAE